jgi:cyclomaltodextrinase
MNNTKWFKNRVIYHILIDRFAGFKSTKDWNKPIFLGGNIKGINEKLQYLNELGVNTIWISPFYKTNTYHGYHVTDFFQVEPNFGTIDDLKELIESIHKYDMKIIADFVPNHCSKDHPYFKDAQKCKNSEFRDWFYFTKWPNEYMCFLSVKDLPKFNLEHKDTKNYVINAAKHWLSFGFDGYRLDHVIGPTYNFWKEFKTEIKKFFPNVILIGEAWMKGIKFNELNTINIKYKFLKWLSGAASDTLFKDFEMVLDGVLDFRLQELLKEYIAKETILKNEFYNKIESHYNNFNKNYFLPTFLDNHDMNRFLFECKNNKEKLKKAAEIQFAIPQPSIIYYGTEIGITQNISIWEITSYGDLQARQPMNWENPDYNLLNFYKKLIKEKKEGII